MSSRDIRRRYGQNYLKDPAILFEMGEVICPNSSDKFIEIGPGLGALTNQINRKDVNIFGIDIDANKDQAINIADEMCKKLLVNLIIEDYEIIFDREK